jgi:hypothetical protein
MADREVTITVRLNDKDAEAKVARLKKAVGDVGGEVKGFTNIEQGSAAAGQAIDALKSQLTSMTGVLGSVASAAGGVGLTFASLGVGALALGRFAFDLTQKFADYAKTVGDAHEETGLAVQTLSALKFGVESTGGSFGSAVGLIREFEKTVAEAENGSVKASAKLARLGIDGKAAAANIDAAFSQAIAKIASLPEGVNRAAAANDAFGESGATLLPVIKEFGGSVDELNKRAKDLGVTLSDDDVRSAAEFNKSLDAIKAKAAGVGLAFGRELADPVTESLNDINKSLDENKGAVEGWARFVKQTLVDMKIDIAQEFNDIGALGDILGTFNPFSNDTFDTDLPAKLAKRRTAELQIEGQRNAAQFGKSVRMGGDKWVWDSTNNVLTPDPQWEKQQAGAASPYLGVSPKAAKATKAKLPELTDEQKQAQELTKIIADLNIQIKFYGDKSEEAGIKQKLLKMGIFDVNKAAGDQAIELAKNLDVVEQKAAADKKAKDHADALAKAIQGISDSAIQERDQAAGTLASLNQQIALGRDLNLVEQQSINDKVEQLKLQHQMESEGDSGKEIANAVQRLETEQKITLELYKQIQAAQDAIAADEKKKQHLKDFEDFKKSIQDQVEEIQRGGRPLSVYEQTLKEINEQYSDMDPNIKNAVLAQADWIDSVKALQAEYDKVKGQLQDIFGYVFRGDFKGLGRSLLDQGANYLSDKLSGALATVLTRFNPNDITNNPVAKPIVTEIKTTNKLLSMIVKQGDGSSSVGGGGSLGSLDSLIASINGGGLGGLGGGVFGGGMQTLPGYGGWTPGGRIPRTGTIDANGNYTVNGNQPVGLSGLWHQIVGPGGIFGATGFGNNVGTYQGIGAIGGMVGQAVGGRFGSALSGAASGLALGAQIGSIIPGVGTAIGAVIGAAGGFLAGLFGFNDPKKKADKEQNIPALQKGFTDSIAQLNKILDDLRHLNIDPDDAINQATAIRADIAGGFGIQFQSKKYRKQAQQMITQQLSQADTIIAQIRSSADIARGAADRSKRILPEFAGGYFADFFRPNGLLPGSFDGADNILAMISRGEMVLNPHQQSRIRGLAGWDIFGGAGIPNYPNPSPSPKLATGGLAGGSGQIVVQPNFQLTIVGMPIGQHIDAYVNGDDGKRTLVKVVTKETTATKR